MTIEGFVAAAACILILVSAWMLGGIWGLTEASRPSANYSRKICQSQKFILRYNGVFGPCEIGNGRSGRGTM
jgi:hypothetical protein